MKKFKYLFCFLFSLFFSNLSSMNNQTNIQNSNNIINEILLSLVNSGDSGFAQKLLQVGANPNFRKNGRNVLCFALGFYDIKMVNVLLNAGAAFVLENKQNFEDLVNIDDTDTLLKKYISY